LFLKRTKQVIESDKVFFNTASAGIEEDIEKELEEARRE
jgi:hypothetical protein